MPHIVYQVFVLLCVCFKLCTRRSLVKYSVLVSFGDVRCYNVHLNNGRLRLRSITSCHTGYGALSLTEEGPCKVHKTGRQPSGRVPSHTGLLLVMSMKLGRVPRSHAWGSEFGLVPEGSTQDLQSASGVSLCVCFWISTYLPRQPGEQL